MYNRVAKNLFLKHFQRDDYRSLTQLERHSKECLWSLQDFKQILGKQTNGGCYVLVRQQGNDEKPMSVLNEDPVGFVVYETHRDHFHLLNIVVREGYRRRGYGSVLLDHMKGKMRNRFLKCDVRDKNLDAHLFLKEKGFVAKGVARGHFQDHYPDQPIEYHDGYLFEYQKDLENEKSSIRGDGCPVSINNMGG